MTPVLHIGNRLVGPGHPVYVVAEMSANHGHSLENALSVIRAAAAAGADAIKLQTYTADTLTIPCDNEYFRIQGGTLWDGRTLHDLYQEAFTPWEWHEPLQAAARDAGLDFFSTPFDGTAVDLLERLEVPVHKVASFEIVDLPLLRRVAATGKPIIMSTGMATLEEIEEAVATIRGAGGGELALLKCTSAYPAPPRDMNLRTLPDLAARFNVPVGLSDHTLDHTSAITAVALGACILEKHFTLDRGAGGPDSGFSLEPAEFAELVRVVRTTEQALGRVNYAVSDSEVRSRVFRRSLFAVRDIRAGESLTPQNVRSIRPGHGLHPRHYEEVLGRTATRDIARGTPLAWDLIGR